ISPVFDRDFVDCSLNVNSGCRLLLLGEPGAPVQHDLAARPGGCASVADEVADCGVIDQRLARPIAADRAEEPVLDRIPLGSPSRIVRDPDLQPGLVRDVLETRLPLASARTIGATGVGDDE